jgi:hypothetical protein
MLSIWRTNANIVAEDVSSDHVSVQPVLKPIVWTNGLSGHNLQLLGLTKPSPVLGLINTLID